MDLRQIPYRREAELLVAYKGRRLAARYRADYVCYDAVIVELKALSRIGGVEQAQIINYLKVSGLETGLVLNFGAASLEYKRFILSGPESASSA